MPCREDPSGVSSVPVRQRIAVRIGNRVRADGLDNVRMADRRISVTYRHLFRRRRRSDGRQQQTERRQRQSQPNNDGAPPS